MAASPLATVPARRIMDFRILGLDPAPFIPLYGLDDEALARSHIRRVRIDAPHEAPDRIELRDAEPGESVLLLNHVYMDLPTPYFGTHAIFVREGALRRHDAVNAVPDALRRRLLSVRAFDAEGMMIDADVAEGTVLEPLVARLLADPRTSFLHAHHARRGCYAARIERA